jgi:hypothetical protein
MRASSCPSAILLLCLSCLGLACGPKPGPAAEPADPGPPVAGEPVGETPTPADESPPSKCFADGGTCVAPSATLECKRFEEGEAWGCTDEGTGCCFQ